LHFECPAGFARLHTLARRFPQLSGRALILKVNRLFRP
jgi:hypothetical protein